AAGGGRPVPAIAGAGIVPPVVVDPAATVRKAVIGPYASTGARVTIDNSIVTDSIVDEGAEIETVMLTRSIVGRDAFVRGYFMQVNVGDSSDITLAGGNHTEGAQPRD